MIFYSDKDVKVTVGDQNIYCSSVSLDSNASTAPAYSTSSTIEDRIGATSPRDGKISLEYYLTGLDPLVKHMETGTAPIKISVAGAYVNSGYMDSYSFSVSPYSDASVSANFVFYEDVKGSISPTYPNLPNIDALSTSDISFTNGDRITNDRVKSFSYNYGRDISAQYDITNSEEASHVTSGPANISADFNIADYDITLPPTGLKQGVEINFKNKNNVIQQTYYLDGIIRSKSVKANIGGSLDVRYALIQGRLGGQSPSILAVNGVSIENGDSSSALNIATGQYLTINGSNLNNVDSLYIGEFPCEIVTSSSTQIYARSSLDMLDGYKAPINLYTQAGYEQSPTQVVTVATGINFF